MPTRQKHSPRRPSTSDQPRLPTLNLRRQKPAGRESRWVWSRDGIGQTSSWDRKKDMTGREACTAQRGRATDFGREVLEPWLKVKCTEHLPTVPQTLYTSHEQTDQSHYQQQTSAEGQTTNERPATISGSRSNQVQPFTPNANNNNRQCQRQHVCQRQPAKRIVEGQANGTPHLRTTAVWGQQRTVKPRHKCGATDQQYDLILWGR